MKRDESPLPIRYSQLAADAYNALGFIALNEGTEESARRAVIHFENQQKVYELIRDDSCCKVNVRRGQDY
jgi:hypothetical protein